VDTGELERLLAGPSGIGLWGTTPIDPASEVLRNAAGRPAVPAPRSGQDAVLAGGRAER
jgi:hypothetical protein